MFSCERRTAMRAAWPSAHIVAATVAISVAIVVAQAAGDVRMSDGALAAATVIILAYGLCAFGSRPWHAATLGHVAVVSAWLVTASRSTAFWVHAVSDACAVLSWVCVLRVDFARLVALADAATPRAGSPPSSRLRVQLLLWVSTLMCSGVLGAVDYAVSVEAGRWQPTTAFGSATTALQTCAANTVCSVSGLRVRFLIVALCMGVMRVAAGPAIVYALAAVCGYTSSPIAPSEGASAPASPRSCIAAVLASHRVVHAAAAMAGAGAFVHSVAAVVGIVAWDVSTTASSLRLFEDISTLSIIAIITCPCALLTVYSSVRAYVYAAVQHVLSAAQNREKELSASVEFYKQLTQYSTHEIRTPFNVMNMALTELQSISSSPECAEHIRTLSEHASMVRYVMDDVLSIAKIRAGKLQLALMSVPLHKLVYEATHAMMPDAQARKVKLLLEANTVNASMHVLADPYRLKQIITNLVSNAIKYCESTVCVRVRVTNVMQVQPRAAHECSLFTPIHAEGLTPLTVGMGTYSETATMNGSQVFKLATAAASRAASVSPFGTVASRARVTPFHTSAETHATHRPHDSPVTSRGHVCDCVCAWAPFQRSSDCVYSWNVPVEHEPTCTVLNVSVEVSDDGHGMRQSDVDRLFSPFHQVDAGIKQRGGGTGLGLSICKDMSARMGARIDVSSRLGEGSTFALVMPLRVLASSGNNVTCSSDPTVTLHHVDMSSDAGVSVGSGGALLSGRATTSPASSDCPSGTARMLHVITSPRSLLSTSSLAYTAPSHAHMMHTHDAQEAAGVGPLLPYSPELDPVSPAPTAPAATISEQMGVSAAICARLHVLCVDDDATTLRMYERLLRTHVQGATITTCTNGRDALEAVMSSGSKVNVVCMDDGMPFMTGTQAAARMREAGFSGLILGMTGNVLDLQEYTGADAVFIKPVDIRGIARHLIQHACALPAARHETSTPAAHDRARVSVLAMSPILPVMREDDVTISGIDHDDSSSSEADMMEMGAVVTSNSAFQHASLRPLPIVRAPHAAAFNATHSASS